MAKSLNFDRQNSLEKPDPKGRIFKGKRITFDLSHILFCLTSVDTIRQLYSGFLRPEILEAVKLASEGGGFYEMSPNQFWSVGRLGKASGYRYRVQNNDEGVTILLSSYYVDEKRQGAHFKVELSPHFIALRGVRQIQAELNAYARRFMPTFEPTGCAIHLALDVQGWSPSADFQDRFTTRSHSQRDYNGATDITFESLAEVSSTFGRQGRQTIMFGKANSLQATIYNKSDEILRSDKVDYFHERWARFTKESPSKFDPLEPVWRIEMRFHHSVIRELAESQGANWKTFEHVSEFLTDLWRYALESQRLEYSATYIDPCWQLFRDDAEFLHPASGIRLRRVKKLDNSAIGRNYGCLLGNLITISARKGYDAKKVLRQLRNLGISFYDDFLRYYEVVRKMDEVAILEMIQKGLLLRKTIGKAGSGFAVGEPYQIIFGPA